MEVKRLGAAVQRQRAVHRALGPVAADPRAGEDDLWVVAGLEDFGGVLQDLAPVAIGQRFGAALAVDDDQAGQIRGNAQRALAEGVPHGEVGRPLRGLDAQVVAHGGRRTLGARMQQEGGVVGPELIVARGDGHDPIVPRSSLRDAPGSAMRIRGPARPGSDVRTGVHIMRRYGRQAHLTSRLDRIVETPPVTERVRPQVRRLTDRMTDADRASIVKDRREGATLPSLMKKYSLTSYSLRLVFAEGGIPPKKTSLSPEQLKQIRELAMTDCSVMQIARVVAAPQSTVRLIVGWHRSEISDRLSPDRQNP